jgi:hypothetical protein
MYKIVELVSRIRGYSTRKHTRSLSLVHHDRYDSFDGTGR